jgi:hypothetical protein
VHVFLNGQLLPQLYMRVCDDGVCVFPDGSLQPPLEATKHMHPVPGVNALRFEVRTATHIHALLQFAHRDIQ